MFGPPSVSYLALKHQVQVPEIRIEIRDERTILVVCDACVLVCQALRLFGLIAQTTVKILHTNLLKRNILVPAEILGNEVLRDAEGDSHAQQSTEPEGSSAIAEVDCISEFKLGSMIETEPNSNSLIPRSL